MDELNLMRKSSAGRSARRPGARRSVHGFTLLEVMIALAILGFGLLVIAASQLHAMRGARSGRHTTRAAVIAQAQMENLQRRSWADIAATAWTAPVAVDDVVAAPTGSVEQRYLVAWRITDLVVGETRSIDVRVQWQEPNRGAREFSLSSVRFNL